MLTKRSFGFSFGIFFDNFFAIGEVIHAHSFDLFSCKMLDDWFLILKDTLLSVIWFMIGLDVFSILFHIVDFHQQELFFFFFLFLFKLKSFSGIILLDLFVPIGLVHFFEFYSAFGPFKFKVLLLKSRVMHLSIGLNKLHMVFDGLKMIHGFHFADFDLKLFFLYLVFLHLFLQPLVNDFMFKSKLCLLLQVLAISFADLPFTLLFPFLNLFQSWFNASQLISFLLGLFSLLLSLFFLSYAFLLHLFELSLSLESLLDWFLLLLQAFKELEPCDVFRGVFWFNNPWGLWCRLYHSL